jgi:hypothetical protein
MLDILIVRDKFGYGLKSVAKKLNSKLKKTTIIKNGDIQLQDTKVLCYWGVASNLTQTYSGKITLNYPDSVKQTSNKLSFYQNYHDKLSMPTHFYNAEDAKNMASSNLIVCRNNINAHGGRGIQIIDINNTSELPKSKYYSDYIDGVEYRVHFCKINGIIGISEKIIQNETAGFNPYIRNLSNGWAYISRNVLPIGINEELIRLQKDLYSIQLDFFAADVRFKDNKYYLLEVNTAPLLKGSCGVVDIYANMLYKYLTL